MYLQKKATRALILLGVFAGAQLGAVVLSLEGDGVQLNYDDLDTDSASLTVNGIDNLYELGFYYVRGNGNVQKLEGGTLIGGDTIRYNPQNNVFVDVQFALPTTSVPDLDINISVQNDRNRAINRSVIFYFDYDLNGGFQNHSANLASDTITINEPGGVSATVSANGANAYQIGDFATLRSSIEAGNLLNNTGAPFVNGDFTGAFQWDFNIPSGGIVTAETTTVIPESGHTGVWICFLSMGMIAFCRKH